MDKKTKLMAICAAGAAVILIGAGLARCAATVSYTHLRAHET